MPHSTFCTSADRNEFHKYPWKIITPRLKCTQNKGVKHSQVVHYTVDVNEADSLKRSYIKSDAGDSASGNTIAHQLSPITQLQSTSQYHKGAHNYWKKMITYWDCKSFLGIYYTELVHLEIC